jgi:hypothetical protein
METMQADRAVDLMSGKHEGERAIAQSAYHHYSLPSARLVLARRLRRHPSVHAAAFSVHSVEARIWAQLLTELRIARLAQLGSATEYFSYAPNLFAE